MLRRRPFPRPLWIGAMILILIIVSAGVLIADGELQRALPSWSGIAGPTPVAFTLIAGHIARIDPATGAILARSADVSVDQFPSLAVTRDGRSLFFLHTQPDGELTSDQLVELSAVTLVPEGSTLLQHYARSMAAWPPALDVTSDDRTIVVEQYGSTQSDPFWLSYYDRATKRLAPEVTLLPNCGIAHLVAVGQQIAVVCNDTTDARLVDLRTRQVTATVPIDLPRLGVVGWPVAAAAINGDSALVVVQDHGVLLKVDFASRTVSVLATFASPSGETPSVTAAAFSSQGRVAVLLAANRPDQPATPAQTLILADATTGRTIDSFPVALRSAALTMSPDGTRLYAVGENDQLQETDLSTHRARPFGPDPTRTWAHLIFAAS